MYSGPLKGSEKFFIGLPIAALTFLFHLYFNVQDSRITLVEIITAATIWGYLSTEGE